MVLGKMIFLGLMILVVIVFVGWWYLDMHYDKLQIRISKKRNEWDYKHYRVQTRSSPVKSWTTEEYFKTEMEASEYALEFLRNEAHRLEIKKDNKVKGAFRKAKSVSDIKKIEKEYPENLI